MGAKIATGLLGPRQELHHRPATGLRMQPRRPWPPQTEEERRKMQMRRELANQALMYGLVGILVILVLPVFSRIA